MLLTRDLDAATAFYGAVTPWDFDTRTAGSDRYVRASRQGVPLADLVVSRAVPTVVARWSVFFIVDDAAVAADMIRDLGATVGLGPTDLGSGRLALATDPAGASFGVWEEDSAPRWTGAGPSSRGAPYAELHAPDIFNSAVFYGRLFNWDRRDQGRYDLTYTDERIVLRIDDHIALTLTGDVPAVSVHPAQAPQWRPYFPVPDVDDTAARAVSSGGSVVESPHQSAYGRTATLADPQGGVFTVVAPRTGAPA
ncbi:VOC family protein [Streptomyces sp. cg36]|uniref:VOC family protein n=1 Tax=Streptomyces sp. cg36 TaxID=3238798 RepID=UPI0034E1CAE1